MNIVEEYLAENKDKKLSINTLHQRLDMRRRTVRYYISKSEHIREVNPMEVGSLRSKISVYTYQ